MSHLRDGLGVTAPLWTNIIPLTAVWNLPLPLPPPKKKNVSGKVPGKFLKDPPEWRIAINSVGLGEFLNSP